VRFQNGFNKVAIELRVVQFWSEIILLISNQTRAARSFDFEIARMTSDQIALHSVQLPLVIRSVLFEKWLHGNQSTTTLSAIFTEENFSFVPYSVEICHRIRHFLSISATIIATF